MRGLAWIARHGEDPVEHDSAILENIHRTLKPGSPFVLTALTGYWTIRQITPEQIESAEFDPATMTQRITEEFDMPGGPVERSYTERLSIPPELVAIVESAGFDVQHVWRGNAARWERKPLNMDEMEFMIVSRSRGSQD